MSHIPQRNLSLALMAKALEPQAWPGEVLVGLKHLMGYSGINGTTDEDTADKEACQQQLADRLITSGVLISLKPSEQKPDAPLTPLSVGFFVADRALETNHPRYAAKLFEMMYTEACERMERDGVEKALRGMKTAADAMSDDDRIGWAKAAYEFLIKAIVDESHGVALEDQFHNEVTTSLKILGDTPEMAPLYKSLGDVMRCVESERRAATENLQTDSTSLPGER